VLNIGLWLVQLLLMAVFVLTGFVKVFQPIDALAATYHWIGVAPPLFVRFVGICELLAAAGLLGPAALRVMPKADSICGTRDHTADGWGDCHPCAARPVVDDRPESHFDEPGGLRGLWALDARAGAKPLKQTIADTLSQGDGLRG
jgi:hypothetical protein